MDDLELERRIRGLLETAQSDAPVAHRWHPPAPKQPGRLWGGLAAAAAVVVFGVVGFALVRGMAGSSDDSASSATETTTGSATATTSASSDGPDTTTGGATDTTSPSETTTPIPCTTGDPDPGGFGTVVWNTQPITVDVSVTPSITCPGRTIHLSFLVDNTEGTSQFVLPDAEVFLHSGGATRWRLGSLAGTSLAPGTSITLEGDFVVPQVPEGTYSVFMRGLRATALLEVRAKLP